MRVQTSAQAVKYLREPAFFTLALLVWACLLNGCGSKDPYEHYARPYIETSSTTTESWQQVNSRGALPPETANAGWERHLITDILQLGPWPPGSEDNRATLDSAWAGFTAFEGTRIAIGGVDSALNQSGRLQDAEANLKRAISRFHQHFPNATIPNVDFSYTGFNYSTYPTDDLLLIGCEFFIGAHHPAVLGLPPNIYPRYMQERMVPEHLAGDAMRGWLLVHFQNRYPQQSRLADELLYWGKVLFITRCLTPEIPAHDLLDFTAAEWDWIRAHEMQVWMELRKEEFLYTSKRMDIQRWVADAPFTKAGDVPQDSPDRLGWYMGLRWVEDFMQRHPEMTLQELMDKQDVLPFLQAYRPNT